MHLFCRLWLHLLEWQAVEFSLLQLFLDGDVMLAVKLAGDVLRLYHRRVNLLRKHRRLEHFLSILVSIQISLLLIVLHFRLLQISRFLQEIRNVFPCEILHHLEVVRIVLICGGALLRLFKELVDLLLYHLIF